ncbi:MAG: DNA polymerase III subunit delta [Armatimonadota bacterium]
MVKKSTGSTDQVYSVYLFTGEADTRRDSALNIIIDQVIDHDFKIFDLQRFDGDNTSASEILAAVSTMPMGSMRKVAVVDRADRLSADDQSKIAKTIPKLSDHSCLILLTGDDSGSKKKQSSTSKDQSDDDDDRKRKGLRAELSNAVKGTGKVISFAKMKSQDIGTLISEIVKSHNKAIDPQALQALIRSSESNPSFIEREIEKLVIYIADRNSITAADVDKLIPRPAEDRVFPLIDAVAAGRSELAINLLNETFAASLKPDQDVLKTISLLARHFRLLYQTKYILTQSGSRNLNALQEDHKLLLMREQNPLSISSWQQDKFMDQSRYFKLDELQQCLKMILSCELTAKGVGNPAGSSRLNLEVLIFRLSQRKSIPLK